MRLATAWMLMTALLVASHTAALGAPAVPAAQPAPTAVPVETLAGIEASLAALETSDLDDASKTKARDFYQQAKQALEEEATWSGRAAELETRAARAPDRLRELEQLLEKGSSYSNLVLPRGSGIAELETRLYERQTELASLEELVRSLDAEPQRRATRRLEIPKEIAAQREQVQDVENQLNTPADPKDPPQLATARRVLLRSRLQGRKAHVAALEAESAAYEAENTLMTLERTYQRMRLTQLTNDLKQLTDEVNQRRQDEAARRHERIRRQRDHAHPALRTHAERNFTRSEETLKLARNVSLLVEQLGRLKLEHNRWTDAIARMKRRVDRGASETTVQLLQSERGKLPHALGQHRQEVSERQKQVRDAQSRMNDLQDESDTLADVDAEVERMRQLLNLQQSPDEEEELTRAIRDLVSMQRELINDQLTKTAKHFETLVALNDIEEQLIGELQAYADYIDERIFWIPSDPVVSWRDFRAVGALFAVLARPDLWREAGRQLYAFLRAEFVNHWVLTAAFAVGWLLLFSRQRRLRRDLSDEGLMAGRGNCLAFTPTARAMLLTLLTALPWGMLMGYACWRLSQWSWLPEGQESTLSRALATGLLSAVRVYLPLEIFRQVCRRRGLAESHFNWSERVLFPLRTHLRWVVTAVLLLTFFAATLKEFDTTSLTTPVARLLHCVLMIVIAVFMQIVFRPQSGVFHEYLTFYPNSWISRLWFVWYPVLCLAPLALAVLAGAGYFYTSWQLALRLHRTIVILTSLTVVGALLMRWLLVSRRRLALRQAQQRQQRMQEQAAADEGGSPVPIVPDQGVDLATINAQTRTLIRSVLLVSGFAAGWLIWVDVLPALAILRDVQLYSAEGIEPGTIVPVTLADLLRAGLVIVMTWVAARNLPGLTEMLLLQHLPLDSSVRYAITTMGRYMIAITGIIVTSAILGVSWRRTQWLVAALGVGLGFGLQEIFANLVSGIILLFERPIRVGDVVTLDNVSGQVTRIRIRATTLTDWDRKELIVPNKDLITGRLLNWTLSDTTNRVVVQVSLAMHADVARARELMLGIARAHPSVLSDPAPSATFEAFNAGTLNIVLRVYLPSLDLRLPCMNDLHMQINQRFREEGIEIAHPQLDVHMRDAASVMIHPTDARHVDPGEMLLPLTISATARSAPAAPRSNSSR